MVDESGADFVTFKKTTADVETKIQAQLAEGVVMTTKTVDVPMNLVIKDKWGMTMKIPFTVTVNE